MQNFEMWHEYNAKWIWFGSSTTYAVHFEYQNNRIIKRHNYGYVGFSLQIWAPIGTDSICYDTFGRVTKIYYDITHMNTDRYVHDEFEYNGLSSQPFLRKKYALWVETNTVDVSEESITYDLLGRITHTEENRIAPADLPEFYHIIEYDYTYNAAGNLATSVKREQQSYMTTTIITQKFSNYDSHKNPYRGLKVPFIDSRFLAYSPNNYRTIESYEDYEGNEGAPNYSVTHYGPTEYNEHDYPLFAIYECP